MKRTTFIVLLGIAVLFAFHPLAAASEEQEKSAASEERKEAKEAAEPASTLFSFTPPLRGAPGNRITGGTRGAGDEAPQITLLAPRQTGSTIRESPTLHWYVSRPTDGPVIFIIEDGATGKTLCSQKIGPLEREGIYGVSLARIQVRLEPGKTYRWRVSRSGEPGKSSLHSGSQGFVQRVAPSSPLEKSLESEPPERAAHVYFAHGIWYDALASLQEQIQARPEDERTRRLCSILLNQEGLRDAAAWLVQP